MGNCILQSKPKSNSMSLPNVKQIKHLTTAVSIDSDNKKDLLTNHLIRSPISDQGDRCTNWVTSSPKFTSRIPVRTFPIKNRNLSKSTSFIRPVSSRIPVTLKTPVPKETNEYTKDLKLEIESCHNQLNESGFVSDFSVTNSGHSQLNMELKSDPMPQDTTDVVVARQPKSQYLYESDYPTHLNNSTSSHMTMPVTKNTKHDLTVFMANDDTAGRSVTEAPRNPHREQKKEAGDVSARRPQSLSCESELLIQKLQFKRCSEIINNAKPISPSPIFQDHSSIMQEVSQLKLMLHKLRRSLLQEPNDPSQNDSLFRPSTPVCTDIKFMSREELEQKYEKLLARNIHLERLLQSREKVIAQIQIDKQQDSVLNEPVLRSPPPDNIAIENVIPKKYKDIDEIPPLHWAKVRIPHLSS